MMAQRQELFAIEAQRPPKTMEMLLDQMEGERVVSGGNRRMRRKYRRRADEIGGLIETHSALYQGADALDHEKRGVTFVGVKDRRPNPQAFEHTHAAYAQNHFLPYARLLVA